MNQERLRLLIVLSIAGPCLFFLSGTCTVMGLRAHS
jgi:hypothetical protein